MLIENTLPAYSEYSPTVPTSIKVPLEFGKSQILLVEGFINAEVTELPTVTLTDTIGDEALKMQIEPDRSELIVESTLKTVREIHKWKKFHAAIHTFRNGQ